jgi:hypothetical protein
VVASVVAVFVIGCGGADKPAAQNSSTPTSTPGISTLGTSALGTSALGRSTPDAAKADAATVALATAATITQADLGAGWTVFSAPKPAEPVSGTDCAAKSTFAELPLDARRLGAQLQMEGVRWYVFSAAAVFPDGAKAQSWVDTRKDAGYIDCRRIELEKEQKATDARFLVATEATTTAGLGTGGYEGYVRYQLKADIGAGPQNSNASFDRHTYRVGRTVVTVSIDILSATTDPPGLETKMSEAVTRALTNVYARINA